MPPKICTLAEKKDCSKDRTTEYRRNMSKLRTYAVKIKDKR